MVSDMVTLTHRSRRKIPKEIAPGRSLSARQETLLSSYLLNLRYSPKFVRRMIVHDYRCAVDIGALAYAADLLFVLERFLRDQPHAPMERALTGGSWRISSP